MTLLYRLCMALTAALALTCLFKTAWVGSVAVAAALTTLWAAATRQLPTGFFRRDPVFLGLGAFAAVVLAQAALGRTTLSTLGAVGNAAAFWALGKMVALQFPTRILHGWKVFALLVLTVVLLGWFGVRAGIFPDLTLGFTNITRTALFTATATLVMLGHALARHHLPAWGPTLIMAALVAATARRATIVALILATAPWLRQPRHILGAGILAAALSTVVLLSGQTDRFVQGVQLTSPSTYERMAAWSAAVRLFQDFPLLGCGFKTFKIISAPYVEDFRTRHPASHTPERLDDAHNIVLHLAAETGGLGLCAMLVVLMAPVVLLWRHRSDPVAATLSSLGILFFLHLQLHLQLFSSNVAALIFTTLGHAMGYLHASPSALHRGLAHPFAPRQ